MAEPKPLRMAAYYYSFDETGSRPVDEILSAVACAGKAYHNTSEWGEEVDGEPSHVELIQVAANKAAAEMAALREMADAWDVDFGNPHEEARFFNAVKLVRAIRKGASA